MFWHKREIGLGVASHHGDVFVFYRNKKSLRTNTFCVKKGTDGKTFTLLSDDAKISGITAPADPIENISHMRVTHSDTEDHYYMVYSVRIDGKQHLRIATSKDLINWEKTTATLPYGFSGMLVANHTHQDQHIMYLGGRNLYCGFCEKIDGRWSFSPQPTLALNDAHGVIIASVRMIPEGIFVLYYKEHVSSHFQQRYTLHGALFDAQQPQRLIWHTQQDITDRSALRKDLYNPFGTVLNDDELITYWQAKFGGLVHAKHILTSVESDDGGDTQHQRRLRTVRPELLRHDVNPLLAPQKNVVWETKGAFNPAAIYEGDVIHILYRAIGEDDVSVIGYATTRDGVTIDERSAEPIFVPTQAFDGARDDKPYRAYKKDFDTYTSGGGVYGGCEDPKVTRVDDRIYMTYVAYNGWSSPRAALTSISVDDFLGRAWSKWRTPVLITAGPRCTKSAVVLPEKIAGKFVVFYRIFPDIIVDYVDDLDALDGKTTFLQEKGRIMHRPGMWDGGKLSIGAPPIKTTDGWLVIYHATTGRQEWPGSDLRYKIGAMLLDLHDPTKVIARTNAPVLEPETPYENDGAKYGIVYPCGAIVKDGVLYVYYGGSDEFVCVARAPLAQFLTDLKNHHTQPHLDVIT